MHSEEESLSGQRLFKDHSWRIAENNLVSGQKTFKKKGFKKKTKSRKENAFTKKQSPAYSDWNIKWDWLLWSDESKKLAF